MGLGTLRLLEAVRQNGLTQKTKFYQASTSELYGLIQEPVQSEKTPFYPRSPYAVAKLYAYWICVNYRESFNMFAANGILFNHESPRRGETFVTRKITLAAARIALGMQDILYLGNLDAQAGLGTCQGLRGGNVAHPSTRYSPGLLFWPPALPLPSVAFVKWPFRKPGWNLCGKAAVWMKKAWTQRAAKSWWLSIRAFSRPAEVELLLGDSAKARTELGWTPRYDLAQLTKEMMEEDIKLARREKLLAEHGLVTASPREI